MTPDLDPVDRAILAALQDDPRRTNRDVAATVGVSASTASERTRALQDRGIVRGAVLDVDLAAIGRPVQAMIAVRIRPPSRRVIEGFREWVRALPEVLGVFVTSGNEDFLVHVAVPDNDSLYAFVIDRLTQRAEIADVRTSVVYEHLRNDKVEPVGGPAPGPRERRTHHGR